MMMDTSRHLLNWIVGLLKNMLPCTVIGHHSSFGSFLDILFLIAYNIKISFQTHFNSVFVFAGFFLHRLECRTCVVVGNGFALKNTSLGSIINKYDVVIR